MTQDAEYACPRCGSRLDADWADSTSVLLICYPCEKTGTDEQTAFRPWEAVLIDGPAKAGGDFLA